MAQQFEFRLRITGPETERDVIVPQGETLIGREESTALPLVYPMVSRRHALINCTAESCTITDLESANGTIVNGERLEPNQPFTLVDGAVITIGPFEVKVQMLAQVAPEQVADEPKPTDEPPPVKKEPAKPVSKPKKPAAEKSKTPDRRGKDGPAGGPPPEPPDEPPALVPAADDVPPAIPGLSINSQRLINYLPGIYHTDFMLRFLGLFESILTPIEWNVDNFDLYLDPGTAPLSFLSWLAGWNEIVFDSTWTESQRRTLLSEAHQIYARRGTRWALGRLIEIYIGALPEIVEFSDSNDPFTFQIKLPLRERDVNRQLLEMLVDSNKPAHSSYSLEFNR